MKVKLAIVPEWGFDGDDTWVMLQVDHHISVTGYLLEDGPEFTPYVNFKWSTLGFTLPTLQEAKDAAIRYAAELGILEIVEDES